MLLTAENAIIAIGENNEKGAVIHMSGYSIFLILIAVVGLTLFIYYSYPRDWIQGGYVRILLIVYHASGVLAMALIFSCYRRIPFEWLKWLVVRWGTMYYIVGMLSCFLFICRLVIKKAFWMLKKCGKMERITVKQNAFWDKRIHSILFLVLSFGIAMIGFYHIDDTQITEYNIHIPKVAAVEELDILLIADLHAGSGNWDSTYDTLEEKIAQVKADVVLLGGDIFDETTLPEDIDRVGEILDKMDPVYGCYYVYGNHDDYMAGDVEAIFHRKGVRVLKDEAVTIAGDIQLLGRLDPMYEHLGIEELIEVHRLDTNKPILVLQHRPKELKALSKVGCDLSMSGHTHGFNIPHFLAIGIISEMLYGIRDYDDMKAIVTSGVAAWGFHYKWPACSEIVHINITFGE